MNDETRKILEHHYDRLWAHVHDLLVEHDNVLPQGRVAELQAENARIMAIFEHATPDEVCPVRRVGRGADLLRIERELMSRRDGQNG